MLFYVFYNKMKYLIAFIVQLSLRRYSVCIFLFCGSHRLEEWCLGLGHGRAHDVCLFHSLNNNGANGRTETTLSLLTSYMLQTIITVKLKLKNIKLVFRSISIVSQVYYMTSA